MGINASKPADVPTRNRTKGANAGTSSKLARKRSRTSKTDTSTGPKNVANASRLTNALSKSKKIDSSIAVTWQQNEARPSRSIAAPVENKESDRSNLQTYQEEEENTVNDGGSSTTPMENNYEHDSTDSAATHQRESETKAVKMTGASAEHGARESTSGIGRKRKRKPTIEELGYMKQKLEFGDGSTRYVYYWPTDIPKVFNRHIKQPKSDLYRLMSYKNYLLHYGNPKRLNALNQPKKVRGRILSPLDDRYLRKANHHVKKRQWKKPVITQRSIHTLYQDAPDTRTIPHDLLQELVREQEDILKIERDYDPFDGNLLAIGKLRDSDRGTYFVVAFPVKQRYLCVRAFTSSKNEKPNAPAGAQELQMDKQNNCAMIPIGYRIRDIKICVSNNQAVIAVRTQCSVQLYKLDYSRYFKQSLLKLTLLHTFKPALQNQKHRQCIPAYIALCPYDPDRYAMVGDTGYVCIFDVGKKQNGGIVAEWFVEDGPVEKEYGERWYACVFGQQNQMLIVATRLNAYCLNMRYMRRHVLFEATEKKPIVAMTHATENAHDRHVIIATFGGFYLMDTALPNEPLAPARHHLGVTRCKSFHFSSERFCEAGKWHMFAWSSVPDYVTHVKFQAGGEGSKDPFLEGTLFAEQAEKVVHRYHLKTLPLVGVAILFTNTASDPKFHTFTIFQLYRNGLLQAVSYASEGGKYKALTKQVLTYDIDTEYEELPLQPEPLKDELSYDELKYLKEPDIGENVEGMEYEASSISRQTPAPELPEKVLQDVKQKTESRYAPFVLSDLLAKNEDEDENKEKDLPDYDLEQIPILDKKLQESEKLENWNVDITKKLLLPFRYAISETATDNITSSTNEAQQQQPQQQSIIKQNIALNKNVYTACKDGLEGDQFHYLSEANAKLTEATNMMQWCAMYWDCEDDPRELKKDFIRPLTEEDIKPLFTYANGRSSPAAAPTPVTPVFSASMPGMCEMYEEDLLPPTVIEMASTAGKKKREEEEKAETVVETAEDFSLVASQPVPGAFGTRKPAKKKPKKKARASGFK